MDRPQRPDPGYFTFEVYNPELDATIVIAMNSDKKVNGEQGINVLLRDISKIPKGGISRTVVYLDSLFSVNDQA